MPLMIEENFTARLLEQLRENELDVICVALPVDLNGLCAWSVYDEDFVVLIPPEHHWADRSEEHTSELQSLMRISYAVFCLKKKKHKQNNYKYNIIKHHITSNNICI